jgi:hypothetical protein
MNTAFLFAAVLFTSGSLWLLPALVSGTVGSDGRLRGWQMVTAFVMFAGAGALIGHLL